MWASSGQSQSEEDVRADNESWDQALELHAGQVVSALTLVIEDTTPEDLAMKVSPAAWEVGRDY